jgi:hypothetical protein
MQQFRRVNVTTGVLGKPVQDEVQQLDVLVASVLFDGSGVIPGPTIEPVKRDDTFEEAGKMPTKIWQ